ncbi:glycosyltransferase [Xanthobacter dioxanivorans]|uniref:Glycosyltransferase n=2 Tax=Xanthobacter dioxanivorans TaxID=2528964 RepID=A0A974SJ10_9HYPH|nr:glycosyltransferase [Xanthobacter dioxanivorans]
MAGMVDLTVVTFEGVEEYPGIRLVTIPAPVSRFERYYGSAWRAKGAVAATVPDLVHAHGDDFLLSHGTPIVRTFYGLSLSEALSSRGLRRFNHFILAGLEQWAARRATTRLGIAVEAVEHFGCESLFPPFFGTTSAGVRRPSETPTIVFIGSFQGRKQGWLAQRAVAGLRATHAWHKARLIVVGPKEDAQNWEPWVDHCSGLSDQDVSGLLAAAWLLVSPSRYEGFGIPIVEALAHGVAVVAIENPGSSYILGQAEPRVPLMLTNEEGFSDAVSTRIENGPLLHPEEFFAAQDVVSRLTRAGSPERLFEIYRETLSKRGRR